MGVQPRHIHLCGSIFVCALLGGIVFGWPSFLPLLESEGVFSDLCDEDPAGTGTGSDSDEPCDEQTLRLGLMWVCAAIMTVLTPLPFGIAVDRFGGRVVARLGAVAAALGVILLIVAGPSFDSYIVGYALIGFSAPALLLGTYPIASYFMENTGMVVAILNGAYDASALVPATLTAVHFATGASLRTVLLVYLCGPVAIGIFLTWFVWPRRAKDYGDKVTTFTCPCAPTPSDSGDSTEEGSSSPSTSTAPDARGSTSGSHDKGAVSIEMTPTTTPDAEAVRGPDSAAGAPSRPVEPKDDPEDEVEGGGPVGAKRGPKELCESASDLSGKDSGSDADAGSAKDPSDPKSWTFVQQLKSRQFLWFLVWTGGLFLKFQLYLLSVGPQLESLGDDGDFISIFSIILPGGFIFLFLVGWVLDHVNVGAAMLILSGLTILQSAAAAVPVLGFQIVTFVFFALFRSFFFSTAAAYLIVTFGYTNFGRLLGTATLAGGVAAVAQYGIFALQLATSFEAVNGVMAVLSLLFFVPPLVLFGMPCRTKAADDYVKSDDSALASKDVEGSHAGAEV